MNYEEIKAAWNAQADEYNQWSELSEIEKIEFAAVHAAEMERASRAVAVYRAKQEEREACEQACWDVDEPAYLGYVNPNSFADGRRACVAAIRARGEQ